jgi:hypothetical protein
LEYKRWCMLAWELVDRSLELSFRCLNEPSGCTPHPRNAHALAQTLNYTQASQYAELFGLNETEVKELTEYLGHWDKLRFCCGSQMSASYRAFLHKCDNHHVMKGGVISNTSAVRAQDPIAREQSTASHRP